jgi:hypothetical protein
MEENFWRLECLALTIEKDRQESNKQLQALGRESNDVRTLTYISLAQCLLAFSAVSNFYPWESILDCLLLHRR